MEKMRRKIGDRGVNLLMLAMLSLFLIVLSGCAYEEVGSGNVTEDQEEIVIPAILAIDPASGVKTDADLIEAFNAEYAGIYQLEVEWVTETNADFRKRMKLLNVKDKLPALISEVAFMPSFYQLLVQEGRVMDVSGSIKADEEWKQAIEPEVLEGCREEDGSIYLVSNGTLAFSGVGIFWNWELFAAAGIETFPADWEEFWACCDQLKEQGITPLALHTEGTGWAPMLLATAYVGSLDGGLEFMREPKITTYQTEHGEQLVSALYQLFQYTSDDAQYRDFDVAYEHFIAGEAAMIPNGYWMLEQMEESFAQNVGFSPFPENMIIASPEMSGWCVVDTYEEDVKAGAVEFLKFRTLYYARQKEEMHEAHSDLPPAADYAATLSAPFTLVPNYQVKWNSIFQEETLNTYLPGFVSNEITAAEFLGYMDESIARYQQEVSDE